MNMKDATNLVSFAGYDYWNRALYKTKSGIIVVDVDGEIHSLTNEGEPCSPLGYATPESVGERKAEKR